MILAKIYNQCRWLHAPAGVLMLLLQRTPALRILSQAEFVIENNGSAVLKSLFGLAALGAYNSIAGATTFQVVPATPSSGPVNQQFAISGTVGTAINESIYVTGAPGNPRSWSETGALPPGLSVTGGNPVNVTSPYKMYIAGTPTTAGSWTVTVTAWSSSNASGDHGTITCAFNITGGAVNTAPVFTTQPQSATVTVGGAVTFTAAASGSPAPTYQWYLGSRLLSGQTASSLNLSSAQTTDAGSYTVVATNAAGSATSSAATLTVNAVATAPSITSQPQSATVTTGSGVTFAVVANSPTALSYQWKKSGAAISGATAASYAIASAQPTDAGSYTVVVTNSVGSVTSSAATLTVQSAPSITAQPLSANASAGNGVTFTVVATGTAPLSYQWQKNGASIVGATAASYSIASAQTTDAGSYTVTVTNPVGSLVSNAAVLTVFTSPAITAQPQAISVTTGSSASFVVVAGGSTPLTYQWQKGGAAITGATNATYTISSAQTADAGTYTVVVSNSLGSVTSSAAALTVTATAVAPSITVQPQSSAAIVGGSAAFVVTATGSAPLGYQWQKGGVAIATATSASFTIASVQSTDAGNYTVVVSNSVGSAISSIATLTVNAAPVVPSISSQPQSASVTAGTTATFSVAASGAAPLNYQWQKGGTAIAGATSASFSIPNAQAADAGNYLVVVSNSVGSVTSAAATLTVNPAASTPTITTQPTSETVVTGHSVSFSIAANSSVTASYQWSVSTDGGATWALLQDNTTYAGTTTSTLTVTNATAAMSGYLYRCAVSNSAGSVNSNALTLSVAVAIFPSPVGVAISSTGVLYVSDSSNNTIQSVSASWQATLVAGASGQQGTTDGTGAAALFRQPGGVTLDSAGNLYVADAGNSIIRKITSAGVVTTLAGSASNQGYHDGVGTAAWFNSPAAIVVDGAGVLYVADSGNAVIRKIAADGTVSTLAGTAGATGSTDGSGASARFNLPSGIALDAAGNLYVADTVNQLIRKITPGGVVTTLAGVVGKSGEIDGTGLAAEFNLPHGLCADSAGNLFVADTGNSAIRRVTSSGNVTTVAGLSSVAGLLDGPGISAWLNQPKDVKVDAAGNLFVADTGNAAIRKITPAAVVTTPVITAAATASPSPPTTTGPTVGPTAADAPPGKSGGGLMEAWFVLGLLVLVSAKYFSNRRQPSL